MIRKINFKQPKYIFPLVVFIPLCALVYFVMQTFGGSEDAQQTVATDRINTELPQANAEEAGDKMYEMSRRFGDEDAFTAIGAIGEEQKENEELSTATAKTNSTNRCSRSGTASSATGNGGTERSLAESRRHINSFVYGDNASGSTGTSRTGQRGNPSGTSEGYTSQDDFARDLEEIQRRSYERQKAIESGLGIGRFDRDEQTEKQRRDSIAKVRQAEKERNRPKLVIKSGDTNAEKFHTVTSPMM